MSYGSGQFATDPELTMKFGLEIDGIKIMAFQKCTIPASEFPVIDNRTGIDPLYKQKSSGLQETENVMCELPVKKDNVSDVLSILNWHKKGSTDKRSGAIIHYDRDGNEFIRWNFTDGWVQKRSEIELDALADDGKLVFTFELAVSHIEPVAV